MNESHAAIGHLSKPPFSRAHGFFFAYFISTINRIDIVSNFKRDLLIHISIFSSLSSFYLILNAHFHKARQVMRLDTVGIS